MGVITQPQNQFNKRLLFTILCLGSFSLIGQSVQVTRFGLSSSLEYWQLQKNVDQDVSLMVQPVSLSSLSDSIGSTLKRDLSSKRNLRLLTVFLNTQYTSNNPYFRNDRGLGRSGGFQKEISMGISGSESILSYQIRPSLIWNQYADYTTFFDTDPQGIIPDYANWMNRIDHPEYQKSSFLLLPGDSYARIEKFGLGLGVSSESLWWGPGTFHSLVMTNNAAGIPHLTFQTIEPKKTFLGTFEGRIILGQLQHSRIDYRDSLKYVFLGQNIKYNPGDDSRLINGITMVYQPKWLKGLFLGYATAFQYYREAVNLYELHFPIVNNIFSKKSIDAYGIDRIYDRYTSVYFKWRMESDMIIYGEFGSNNNEHRFGDFFRPQQNGFAWVGGISKYNEIKNGNQLAFQLEAIRLQQPSSYAVNHIDSWYIHSQVRHGYTHRGDVIGSGIGPGANAQTFRARYLTNQREIGLRFERLAHNRDFYNFHFVKTGNFKKWWIDYTVELSLKNQWGPLILSGELAFVYSLNYQWDNKGIPTSANQIPFGNNQLNPLLSVQLLYLPGFKKDK